jgi:hypothetical protein
MPSISHTLAALPRPKPRSLEIGHQIRGLNFYSNSFNMRDSPNFLSFCLHQGLFARVKRQKYPWALIYTRSTRCRRILCFFPPWRVGDSCLTPRSSSPAALNLLLIVFPRLARRLPPLLARAASSAHRLPRRFPVS